MNELKRLLRRLDGLDGNKGLSKGGQSEAEERGYVGALRGAPQHEDDAAPAHPLPAEKKGANSAVFVAAAAAAAISTVTVYLVMSWQANNQGAGPIPSVQPVVPSKLDFKSPMANPGTGRQSDTADNLVRRAEILMQSGQIEPARALLQEAAEMGSGAAALKLGRSYDPSQATSLRFADSQTNSDLAKAWYERALALGSREAAGYISDPGAR